MLKRAAELFADGMTVREVAATLAISKSEAVVSESKRWRARSFRLRMQQVQPN
jgi:hypothetical protein